MVKYHTMDTELDPISAAFKTGLCPQYEKYLDEWKNSSVYKKQYETVTTPLMATLSKAMGLSFNSTKGSAFNCLSTHLCNNFSIPDAVTQDLYEAVVADNTFEYRKYMWPSRKENARVSNGFLLREIGDNIAGAVGYDLRPRTGLRFALMSAHDDTIAGILIALGVWDGTWPQYASFMAFEVYGNAKGLDLCVRMVFNGKVPVKDKDLAISYS